MEKRKRFDMVNGGISLILLLFIVLSLVSFAALSIVSARADLRLSEKYAAQTDGYYAAHNLEQEWLKELAEGTVQTAEIPGNASMISNSDRSADPAMSGDIQDSSDRAGSTGSNETERFAASITMAFSAGENMELVVTAERETKAGTQKGSGIRILSEKMRSTVEYEYDTTLKVLRR